MGNKILFQGATYELHNNESVLDCLLRNNLNTPYSCKSGACQSCMLQIISGSAPKNSQIGLKETLVHKGIFLACQCIPTENIEIQKINDQQLDIPSSITLIEKLNHNVIRVIVKPQRLFECESGQFITLINTKGVARSYSIANNPKEEKFIELHIKLLENGLMGCWFRNEAKLNDQVIIRGPAGYCFYADNEDKNYPIILAGTGTGLAPLYGIARDALNKGHQGSITLLHGGRQESDLYLTAELRNLDNNHKNFAYIPCLKNGNDSQNFQIGDITDITLSHLPEKKNDVRLFLCGAPEMVTSLKTKAFLSGVSSKNIFSDAFLSSK